MKLVLLVVTLLISAISYTECVDRELFKECWQSNFCSRCRAQKPGKSNFTVDPSTLRYDPYSISAEIVNSENLQRFEFLLQPLVGEMFRFKIDEKSPLKPRYKVVDSLKSEPRLDVFSQHIKAYVNITSFSAGNKVVVHFDPFEIKFYRGNLLTVVVNGKGLMRFEHLREKPIPVPPEQEGMWEEYFHEWLDTKPNGPEAVALDFTFTEAKVLFGIPEHAETFALRVTTNNTLDPYRLYNLDVPGHDIGSTMALYGSVPILYGHGPKSTAGVFWHNAAETWVDIHANPENASFAQGAHFFSESGIIDVIVILSDSPNSVFQKYTDLTGVTAIPQLYTLGYHQCRWNYDNQTDVMNVNQGFNTYNIPMDTIWLDIEYTDGKRYFTWNRVAFPNPLKMIGDLAEDNRHLIIIIDIHKKQDENYWIYREMRERNLFVKNSSNELYVGECWPGLSCYPDVLREEARTYLASQYQLYNFNLSTERVMIWNDMNEPSTFNGPEKTFPKDNIHYGNWEHRHVHNIYGHMQLKSTFDGLSRRSNFTKRPFVLSRAHYSGSQRYAAIWTGDNLATWEFLKVSIQTCLTQAVSGFSFCGADVGGFSGHPSNELFERWYQAGSFQPFFRSHADISAPRREPWLFGEETLTRIRNAIRKRYTFLPFWYTLFYEHEQTGLPIMRPLLSHYPNDVNCYAIDNAYLLAHTLLIRPVSDPAVRDVDVYLPSGDLWYDIDDYVVRNGSGKILVPVDKDKLPVYQRGGTIVPKKDSVYRLSSPEMKDDPYTLVVCLDQSDQAQGTVFIDDEESYEYRDGRYIYQKIQYINNILSKVYTESYENFNTNAKLNKVIIAGLDEHVKAVTLIVNSVETVLHFREFSHYLVIENINVNMTDRWSITFHSSPV